MLTNVSYLLQLHILLVDDDAQFRHLVMACLNHDGHTVATASNGEEGWTKFQAGQFDVVITDWSMPGMSGDQLAAAVKQTAPKTRVVMITGNGQRMVQHHLYDVDVLLHKPFRCEALLEALWDGRVRGQT